MTFINTSGQGFKNTLCFKIKIEADKKEVKRKVRSDYSRSVPVIGSIPVTGMNCDSTCYQIHRKDGSSLESSVEEDIFQVNTFCSN